MPNDRDLIAAMARQLPPSAATLRLLDVGAVCGDVLQQLRPDIDVHPVSLNPADWQVSSDFFDAITVYDRLLDETLLAAILRALRPGGRLIAVQPVGQVSQAPVTALEAANYVRILVEAAVAGEGVLIRGEKVHTTANTRARVEVAAGRDADNLTLDTLRGRYVHVLVHQRPNKPVWKLSAEDRITWDAAAIVRDEPHLLAFSSLPKAVQFLQDAVMQGFIRDINKIAKFDKAVIAQYPAAILMNPTFDQLAGEVTIYLAIDPDRAEAPDE